MQIFRFVSLVLFIIRHLQVYLYGGHVTSWKDKHGEEFLFMSSKVYIAFSGAFLYIKQLVVMTDFMIITFKAHLKIFWYRKFQSVFLVFVALFLTMNVVKVFVPLCCYLDNLEMNNIVGHLQASKANTWGNSYMLPSSMCFVFWLFNRLFLDLS